VTENTRYSRQINLPDWGTSTQKKLQESCVLIIGAGALGSHAAVSLCAAGIGTIIIYDPDIVELHNLHRQMYYTESDCGQFKTDCLLRHMNKLNSNCLSIGLSEKWTENSQLPDSIHADIILDGSDNFSTKYQIHAYSRKKAIPWIYASVLGFRGEVTLFTPNGICYRCLYPDPPDTIESCDTYGVVPMLPAILAHRQAWEVIAYLSETEPMLYGKLWQIDLQTGKDRTIILEQANDCQEKCIFQNIYEATEKTEEIDKNELLQNKIFSTEAWRLIDLSTSQTLYPDNFPPAVKTDPVELETYIRALAPSIKILLICPNGNSSRTMANLLKKKGISNFIAHLKGGFRG